MLVGVDVPAGPACVYLSQHARPPDGEIGNIVGFRVV